MQGRALRALAKEVQMLVVMVVALLLMALLVTTVYIQWQVYRLRDSTLRDLLRQIRPVRTTCILQLAGCVGRSEVFSFDEALEIMGGEQTLDALAFNSAHMIVIARHLSLIDPECQRLAAQIRRDALSLQEIVTFLRVERHLGIRVARKQLLFRVADKYSRVFKHCNELYIQALGNLDASILLGVTRHAEALWVEA